MTYHTVRPASPSWRGRAAGAAVVALLLFPGAAHAATPALRIAPESGGPGTPLTLSGSGFCGRTGCGPVRISISGRQLAAGQRPNAAGAFKATAQAPGGLTAGEHEIVAHQVLDDGNEINATASFVYSPSRGEEAEREAETRDAIANLENSNAPTPKPRGVPLASAIASLTASETASSTPLADGDSVPDPKNDGGLPVALVLSLAAGLAALVAGALWWRRRSLGGTS